MNIKNTKIILIIIIFLVIAGVLFWVLGYKQVEIKPEGQGEQGPGNNNGINPITGLKCDNYDHRPIAVMLAIDPITRPLSGIGAADLVIEMPVITNSITRIMAVYICEDPEEIGSLRSARHDFIPLALGLDAIYAHWGGSHFALDKLYAGIIDNIDAMKNPYNAYWQKSGTPMPHNGFSSLGRLINAAENLGYRLKNKFEGYPHIDESKLNPPAGGLNSKQNGRLTIGYAWNFRVYYDYDSKTNNYKRFRTGTPEMDKLTDKQVEVQNVIIMKADSRMIEPPNYNDVDVEGSGEAIIYRNGEEVKGTWKKEGSYSKSKLYFLDSQGQEIPLVPGKIWIEIIEPNQQIKWE